MVIKQNFQHRQAGSCNTALRHSSLVRTLTSNLPKIYFARLLYEDPIDTKSEVQKYVS